jgi:hypothetical protein
MKEMPEEQTSAHARRRQEARRPNASHGTVHRRRLERREIARA